MDQLLEAERLVECSNHPPIADDMLSTDGKGTLLKDYSFAVKRSIQWVCFVLSVKANMKPLIPWTVISVPSGQSFVELFSTLQSGRIETFEKYATILFDSIIWWDKPRTTL